MDENNKRDAEELERKTIADFGEQWSRFHELSSWTLPGELFNSILPPLVVPEDINGKNIAKIGAGTGNITTQLLQSGPNKVIAEEPSAAWMF